MPGPKYGSTKLVKLCSTSCLCCSCLVLLLLLSFAMRVLLLLLLYSENHKIAKDILLMEKSFWHRPILLHCTREWHTVLSNNVRRWRASVAAAIAFARLSAATLQQSPLLLLPCVAVGAGAFPFLLVAVIGIQRWQARTAKYCDDAVVHINMCKPR